MLKSAWIGRMNRGEELIHKYLLDPQNTRIFICGPEIMMKFALIEIMRFEVPEDEVFLSMERNMKCATGFCGHCLYGPFFICKDGPIFSFKQIKNWFNIKEL
jgi:NAD(P)H-flavin reductase